MRKQLKGKSIILCLCLWMVTALANAQEVKIQGKVTDATDQQVIPGVNIVVKGTTQGVMTGADGSYQISTKKGATLVFSFIGYQTQEIVIDQTTNIDVAMVLEAKEMNEVVVIGYGSVKKTDLTGSVVAVDSKDFNKGAITSAQDLLVGKTAGVVITAANGAPGTGSTIRIRGGSSLNASNDPLIIVDGVPVDNSGVSGASNILDVINPNDIESFTVLKDASATAIYGSRASNGVIIITTKKGLVGKELVISYNGNTSFAAVSKYVDVYSGDEFRNIANSLVYLNGLSSLSVLGSQNTNWQSQIFRVSESWDHNLSLTGAVGSLPFRLSIGYTDNQGIMVNTGFNRGTASLNLNPSLLNNSLKVSINAKTEYTNYNYGDAGSLGSAVSMDPTQAIHETDPAYANYFQWAAHGNSLGTPNPVEQANARDNQAFVKRLMGNIQLDYALPAFPDLHANLNLGLDNIASTGHNDLPSTAPNTLTGTLSPTATSAGGGRQGNFGGNNWNSLLDFYLNYKKNIDAISSKVDVTAGYSWQHFKESSHSYDHSILGNGTAYQMIDSTSSITENYLISFFGRLNYTLLDRYLLTVTLRDDGSSRFSSSQRWGIFPSVALAWKVKDEAFLKSVDAISDLKIRLGYGVTGQQNIVGNDYPSQALYVQSTKTTGYEMSPGVFVNTERPNAFDPNIKWEQTITDNIGLDLGLFKNRITANVDFYKRLTSNLLEDVPIAMGSNYSNYVWTNVGSMQNLGYEVTLNLIPISTKDMGLTIGFNLAFNQNKITKLSLSNDPSFVIQGADVDLSSGYLQVDKVGSPANSFFMNKQVYDSKGNPIEGAYVDLSGQGGAVYKNGADQYIDHNPAPTYTMGISFKFNYKNFDISASGRAELDNYVYNQVAAGASYNQMYQLGYWKNMPKYLDQTKFVNRQYASDYFVQNASFFKLDNASAGYNFPTIKDKLHIRLSFTAQNLFVITDYQGQDPEVGFNNGNAGIDNNYYPRARTYLVGLSLSY